MLEGAVEVLGADPVTGDEDGVGLVESTANATAMTSKRRTESFIF